MGAGGNDSSPTELHWHRVEPLSERHLRAASAALRAAFEGTIWHDMGRPFLRCVLGSFVRQNTGVAYVYLCGDKVVGLVVGAEDARRHRGESLRRRGPSLVLLGMGRLATRPMLLARVLPYARPYVEAFMRRVVRRGAGPGSGNPPVVEQGEIPPASLILLGVVASHRGHGVGEHLTRVFLDDLARRNVARVKLAVGAENAPALKVYESTGWRLAGKFPKPAGGAAYRLIYDLAAAARRKALLAGVHSPRRIA